MYEIPLLIASYFAFYGGRIPSGESDWEIYGWRSSRGIPSGFGYYHGATYAILARTPGLFIPVVLAHVA